MTNLSGIQLSGILGGASQSPDPISGLKRASESKPGHGGLDLYGSAGTGTSGIGVEARQLLTPSISVFGQGHIGTKDDKPDNGVMGGVRFEW